VGLNHTDEEIEMSSPTTFIGALALACAAGLTAAVGRSTPDEGTIRRHIERYYFEGVRRSDTATAHRAFHPVVTMYSVRDGEFAQRSIPDWLAAIAERAPDPPAPDTVPRRIVSVDVTGNAAMAKLELAYPEATFTDYMSLLKVNGKWIIVGKIFDRQPRTTQAAGR
jgi:putative lumazine-binding protein